MEGQELQRGNSGIYELALVLHADIANDFAQIPYHQDSASYGDECFDRLQTLVSADLITPGEAQEAYDRFCSVFSI